MPRVDVLQVYCYDEQEPNKDDGPALRFSDEVFVTITNKANETFTSAVTANVDKGEYAGIDIGALTFRSDGYATVRLWEDDGALGRTAEDDLIGAFTVDASNSGTHWVSLSGSYAHYAVQYTVF